MDYPTNGLYVGYVLVPILSPTFGSSLKCPGKGAQAQDSEPQIPLTGTATSAEEVLACGDLPIDYWNESMPGSVGNLGLGVLCALSDLMPQAFDT